MFSAFVRRPLGKLVWSVRRRLSLPLPRERRRDLPIYCVRTAKRLVALTFDAGWDNEDAAEILAILSEHNVRATFFVTGQWVKDYPADTKAILAAGHELGNHSMTHPAMTTLPDADKRAEIEGVHEEVLRLTGEEMKLFRPPFGDYDDAVIATARAAGYAAVQWDVDSLDWKERGADDIIRTVTRHPHLGRGSIILCHVGTKCLAAALAPMIVELKRLGYGFVLVSELIARDNFYMDREGRQIPVRSRR